MDGSDWQKTTGIPSAGGAIFPGWFSIFAVSLAGNYLLKIGVTIWNHCRIIWSASQNSCLNKAEQDTYTWKLEI